LRPRPPDRAAPPQTSSLTEPDEASPPRPRRTQGVSPITFPDIDGRCAGVDLSRRRATIRVVSPDRIRTQPSNHGDVLTAVSDGLVALLKEFYGRGPTQAKSYYEDDLVVCVLRGGFSRVEQTLLDGGRGAAVIEQRMAFQDLMRSRFESVIEDATGRKVVGFMSGNQQSPDMMCEVFILAPTDLIQERTTGDPRLY
jgi:uncharacterized protein YbcI